MEIRLKTFNNVKQKSLHNPKRSAFKKIKGASTPKIIALQTNQSTFSLFGHIV